MSNITVSSSAELLSALAAASSGDTIMLAAGSYAGLGISNLHFPEGVTITSADPANPARIMDFAVRNSSGLTFTNLEFDASGDVSYYEFGVFDSTNIHFKNIHMHGSLDGNPSNDETAFMIRASTNVSVVDSEFEQLENAISHMDSDGLLFSGNSFHDIGSDGIKGGGSSNVTITRNSFTDFFPSDGDHPDAIQFWTVNSTAAAKNIIISENLITRGSGGLIQGIFVTDQSGLRFENVTISNNMLVGTHWNGIVIGGAINANVSDNAILSGGEHVSRIWMFDVNGLTLANNVAGTFLLADRNTNVSSTGSTVLVPTAEQVDQMLAEWLAAHRDSTSDSGGDTGGDSGGDTGGDSGGGTGGDSGSAGGSDGGTGGTSDPAPPTTDGAYVRAEFGTLGDDQMDVSGSGAVRLAGLGGNDMLTDSAGVTCWLEGGGGDDLYFVDGSATTLIEKAGEGYDTVYASVDFCLAENVEALELEGTAVSGTGNALNNLIRGTGAHNALNGLDGNDQIFAGHGDDELDGGLGDDLLDGGSGTDVLRGGAGADVLVGGGGDDLLYGGDGRDVFVYSNDDVARRNGPVDTIMDYSGDLIDLSAIDALARTKANDAFTFIGENAFTNDAGQLRVYDDGKNTYLSGDVDGNGKADFELCLVGVHDLSASDILL